MKHKSKSWKLCVDESSMSVCFSVWGKQKRACRTSDFHPAFSRTTWNGCLKRFQARPRHFCSLAGLVCGKCVGPGVGPGSGLSSSFPGCCDSGDVAQPLRASGSPFVTRVNMVCLTLSVTWPFQCSASSRVSVTPTLLPLPIWLSAMMPCGVCAHQFLYPFLYCRLGAHRLGKSIYSEYRVGHK